MRSAAWATSATRGRVEGSVSKHRPASALRRGPRAQDKQVGSRAAQQRPAQRMPSCSAAGAVYRLKDGKF